MIGRSRLPVNVCNYHWSVPHWCTQSVLWHHMCSACPGHSVPDVEDVYLIYFIFCDF